MLKVGIIVDEDNFDCVINSTKVEGYSIDILGHLKEFLNCSIDYQILNELSNLTELLMNELDLVVCHPYVKDLNTNDLTELYPTIKSKHIAIYKLDGLNFTKDIFILTFAGLLWSIFFLVLVVLALCLRISTTQYSMIPPKEEPWTWVEITLWAIAAACQQGLSHTPSGFASCTIFFLGYLMAYLLYTGFAAAITSILVQHDVNIDYNLDSIKSDHLVLISLEMSHQYIQSFKDNFVRLRYVENLKDFFIEINQDNRIGVGPEIIIQQYMSDHLSYEEVSSYIILKLDIEPFQKGFLISRKNSRKELLNKQILRMEESGIIQHVLERNLHPEEIVGNDSGYSSAGREHVGSATLIFLGGVLASILFLLAEFVLSFYQRNRNHLGL